MTSPWETWKAKNLQAQKEGRVTPTALLNPETPRVTVKVKNSRLAICDNCPSYMASKQCKECGCFMPVKTELLYASCPKGLW